LEEEMPDIVVRVVPRAGTEGELGGATLTERFEQRVDELGSSISDIAHRLRSRLDTELSEERSSAWGLNEVHLTFSLDLEAMPLS
jgi:hypothetical protein